jgi:AraC family transcriptional regulator
LDRLLTSKLRILDIALLAGFESQEAFARAFKMAFGLTPQEYRRLGDKSLFLKKAQFDRDYLRHINQNISLEPELYLQPRMILVGLRTQFFGVDSEKNNIGERLPPLWQRFIPRLAEIELRVPGLCYGVVRQDPTDGERLEYHAAIEVLDAGSVPDGMVVLEVPEAKYAKFAHQGPAREVDHTVSYVYSTWLAQSGLRHSYGPDLEIYGQGYDATSAQSLFHYAIPTTDSGWQSPLAARAQRQERA